MPWSALRAFRPSSRLSRRSALRMEVLEDRTLPASGIGTFLPSSMAWSLRFAAAKGAADANFTFGNGSIPVAGDWDGDGQTDIGTFNSKTATWSLRYEQTTGPA